MLISTVQYPTVRYGKVRDQEGTVRYGYKYLPGTYQSTSNQVPIRYQPGTYHIADYLISKHL